LIEGATLKIEVLRFARQRFRIRRIRLYQTGETRQFITVLEIELQNESD